MIRLSLIMRPSVLTFFIAQTSLISTFDCCLLKTMSILSTASSSGVVVPDLSINGNGWTAVDDGSTAMMMIDDGSQATAG